MTPTPIPGTTELARADLVFLLAKVFGTPTETNKTELSLTPEEIIPLVQAANLPLSPVVIPKWIELGATAQNTTTAEWTDEYSRLFLGNINCPLHESAYIRRDKGTLLSDIAAFYTAFGVMVDPQSHQRHDHLCAELEFVAILWLQLARAKTTQNPEATEIVADALKKFNADHLMEWLASFTQRVLSCNPHPIYALGAELIWATWQDFSAEWGTQTEETVYTPAPDPGTPYECDMAAGMV